MNRRSAAATGRPLQFSPDDALEKAMRLFWERGFEATSMQELQERTGLSRSSLYNTFGSKRALFERAVRHYGAPRDRGAVPQLKAGTRGLDDVHAFLEALVASLSAARQTRGCFMVNTVIEFGGEDARVRKAGADYFGRVQSALLAALRRAAERGEIAASGLEGRARLLLAIAMGINVQARAGASRKELAQLAHEARAEIEAWRHARAAAKARNRPS